MLDCKGKEQLRVVSPKGVFTSVVLVILIEKLLQYVWIFSNFSYFYTWVKSFSMQTPSLSNYKSHAIYQNMTVSLLAPDGAAVL